MQCPLFSSTNCFTGLCLKCTRACLPANLQSTSRSSASFFLTHTYRFFLFDRFGFRIVEVKNAVWSSSIRSVLVVTFSAILAVQCVLSGQACRLNLKTVLSQWFPITTMDSATFPVSLCVFLSFLQQNTFYFDRVFLSSILFYATLSHLRLVETFKKQKTAKIRFFEVVILSLHFRKATDFRYFLLEKHTAAASVA